MDISVVIPTHSRPETLENSVGAILNNSKLPKEIIIVDQSPDDKTRLLIEKYSLPLIKYVRDEGSGAARARNIGWKNATGDIISFTDDDATVDANWIESIIFTFEKFGRELGICGGKIIPVYEQKNTDWSIPDRWYYLLPAYAQGDTMGEYINGALPPNVNYSTTKELLVKMGGFNEALGPNNSKKITLFGEDSEFTQRVLKEKLKVIYNPDCIVYHPVPLSRQNQKFLNKRLFLEGVSLSYMTLILCKFPFFVSIYSIFKECVILLRNKMHKHRMDVKEYEGVKHLARGKIYGFLMFGLLGRKNQ